MNRPQRLPRPRQRSHALRSVHPQQLTLGLAWSADDLAARRHLRLLPSPERTHEPIAPAAVETLRRAA